MAGRPPAFQFYAKDWISSKAVRMMNPVQRGYYIQLMAEAWDSTPIGHLPNDPEILRILAGEQDLQCWESNHRTVLEQFKVRGKMIYSPRLVAERKKQCAHQQNKRKAGSASAKIRKDKELTSNRTTTEVPTEINSSSSSSFSSSSSTSSSKQEESKPSPRKASADAAFELAYQHYPRHVGKRAADKAWNSAVSRGLKNGYGGEDIEQREDFIYQRVMQFAAVCERIHKPKGFIPHMATWLNQDRFLDDPSEWAVTGNGETNGQSREQRNRANIDAGIDAAIAEVSQRSHGLGKEHVPKPGAFGGDGKKLLT